ncbi:hypothetical protein M422DRAFT_260023, partial [Sphaerobolus stellatus SS14]
MLSPDISIRPPSSSSPTTTTNRSPSNTTASTASSSLSSSLSSSYLPALLRPKTMLKLWTSTPDQTTPKASAIDRNPFDVPRLNPVAASDNGPPRKPSHSSTTSATTSSVHHLLNVHTANAGQLTPLELGPLTPGAASNFAAVAAALPTTQLSLNPPDFKMKSPP